MRISDWSSDVCSSDLILSENDSWQNAVNGAVAARASLAETAEADRDYIRPIVLFQAQQRDQEVTVEVLKKHLIETENIPAEKIAVATGDQRGLDGIDLFDPACPIERSEEHTSELQSLMRISYAVFCLKKKNKKNEYR